MEIRYHKRFLKDLAKVPLGQRDKIEKYVFEEIVSTNPFNTSGRFEKLKGYNGFYKIRFGDYRVGISYVEGMLTFERVLHRKEIYRFFP